jgi:4-hydroxy-3-polyprenylbenzoate decarboxylase
MPVDGQETGTRRKSVAAPRNLVVGLSGASGAIYTLRLLDLLRSRTDVRTHLVASKAGLRTLSEECGVGLGRLRELADEVHSNADIGASIASGSFHSEGMIVAPCSIKTLSEIAFGMTSTLLSRAADVMLKERRRLVLMLRETPLHLGHIQTMARATESGAIIYPPVPAFYQAPESLTEMVDQTLGRVLDLFDIDLGTVRRWSGSVQKEKAHA